LTTFIDHRLKPTHSYAWAFPGAEKKRNKRSITCQIAKKVLDDSHFKTKEQNKNLWESRCRFEWFIRNNFEPRIHLSKSNNFPVKHGAIHPDNARQIDSSSTLGKNRVTDSRR